MKNISIFTFILLILNILKVNGQIISNFQIQNILPTNQSILYPQISFDGKHLVFLIKEKDLIKVYESTQSSQGEWLAPVSVDSINVMINENFTIESPRYNYDATEIYFCLKSIKDVHNADIYVSKKIKSNFQKPEKLLTPINTTLYESDPFLTEDGKMLYFVREYENKEQNIDLCTKIYYSKKENEMWSEPIALPEPVNEGCERTPFLSADGKTFYLSSIREGGKGGFDLYFAKMIAENVWQSPIAIDTLNSENDELSPSVNAIDNKIIFQLSEGKGKKRIDKLAISELLPQFCSEKKIFVTGKITDLQTNLPITAKIQIIDPNTSIVLKEYKNDEFTGKYSYVLQNNNNYRINIFNEGFSHIFINEEVKNPTTIKIEDNNFQLYSTVSLLLNVYDNEIFEPYDAAITVINSDTKQKEDVKIIKLLKGRYTLTLPIGKNYEIKAYKKYFQETSFKFDLTAAVQFDSFERDIELISAKKNVDIFFSDSETGEGVEVSVEITNLSTNEKITRNVKTGRNGEVSVDLRDGNKYDISVNPKGYGFYNTVIELDSENAENTTITAKLTPLNQETKIELSDINFEFNSADLKASSFVELDRVVKLLQSNPDMIIEISAHTDDVGAQPYNLKLSIKRAESAVAYISDKGISKDKLQSKGYGKSQPKYLPANTDENRQKNRRVEMKIIDIKK